MTVVSSYLGVLPPKMEVAIAYNLCPRITASGGVPVTPVPVAGIINGGTVGVAYSETISAQGGTAPYTFAVISGSLPASLTLNSATGVISGTPTIATTSSFTIRATDANGNTGQTNFQITIAAPSVGGGAFTFLA